MAKLVIRRQPPRKATAEDVAAATEACVGGTTARTLAGRTGMNLLTAFDALAKAQAADPSIRTEYIPLKGSHACQHLFYKRLG